MAALEHTQWAHWTDSKESAIRWVGEYEKMILKAIRMFEYNGDNDEFHKRKIVGNSGGCSVLGHGYWPIIKLDERE